MGSPLNVSYAEFFRFMLRFLCLQMCVCGGSAVPQGGVGDRHLVTVPQGVVGERLPWGGERQGAGGVPVLPPAEQGLLQLRSSAGCAQCSVLQMEARGNICSAESQGRLL